MIRDRAWRRHIEQKKVKSRLKIFNQKSNWWYAGYSDLNDINRVNPNITDYIGGDLYKMYKTYTTCRIDSKYKCKYSPNKRKVRWRDNNKKGTREKHKVELLNTMKEYGLK